MGNYNNPSCPGNLHIIKMKIKIEDVIFWVIILLIIATALWLLLGSPPETDALISIALFVAASELLIWRKLFDINKKTAVGFEKVKSELENIKNKL